MSNHLKTLKIDDGPLVLIHEIDSVGKTLHIFLPAYRFVAPTITYRNGRQYDDEAIIYGKYETEILM